MTVHKLLLGACATAFVTACAGTGSPATSTTAPARQAGTDRCSLRAVVNVRSSTSIRNDAELVDVARRMGVTMDVLQPIGRNSKMVMIRENGPPRACEESLSTLRNDPRIESVDRY